MKVVAVVSQKGGVGKTTVALNLAYALARRNHRLLLVDADPQGAVGLSLQRPSTDVGLAGYVADRTPLEQVVIKTRIPELELLPVGNIAFQDAHPFACRMADGTEMKRLVDEARSRYSVMLIDTPAGFGGSTMGVLRVADLALAPLQAEPVALRSAAQLLEVLGALRQEGHKVKLAGVVLTMLELRNPDSLAVATQVWAEFPTKAVFQTSVPRDRTFLQASSAGVPLGLLSRRPPPVAAVFDQLAQELEPHLELEAEGKEDGPIALFA
ncbi:MAG TPA: ParA family protein [Myxococcales bacterium]|jgi:chromosome partitioning protein|nr:ParA family protein [Myxococcales bacterium]